MGPDDDLYVTGPTLATYDRVYRVSMDGRVETIDAYVRAAARAGLRRHWPPPHRRSARRGQRYLRLRAERPRELIIGGARLVGLAFGAKGRLVVATSDTVYNFS